MIYAFGQKQVQTSIGPPLFQWTSENLDRDLYSLGMCLHNIDLAENANVLFPEADLSECAYCLRYVELNGRTNTAEPWSLRQIGVYQRHNESRGMTWIFVATRDWMEQDIASFIQKAGKSKKTIEPQELHCILVNQSLAGWAWYLEDLSGRVKHQVSYTTDD